jgi:hypothetical protein
MNACVGVQNLDVGVSNDVSGWINNEAANGCVGRL